VRSCTHVWRELAAGGEPAVECDVQGVGRVPQDHPACASGAGAVQVHDIVVDKPCRFKLNIMPCSTSYMISVIGASMIRSYTVRLTDPVPSSQAAHVMR